MDNTSEGLCYSTLASSENDFKRLSGAVAREDGNRNWQFRRVRRRGFQDVCHSRFGFGAVIKRPSAVKHQGSSDVRRLDSELRPSPSHSSPATTTCFGYWPMRTRLIECNQNRNVPSVFCKEGPVSVFKFTLNCVVCRSNWYDNSTLKSPRGRGSGKKVSTCGKQGDSHDPRPDPPDPRRKIAD